MLAALFCCEGNDCCWKLFDCCIESACFCGSAFDPSAVEGGVNSLPAEVVTTAGTALSAVGVLTAAGVLGADGTFLEEVGVIVDGV